jgi:O-antigen ligase
VTQAHETATGSPRAPAALGQRQAGGAAWWFPQSAAPASRPRQFRWFTPALALLLGGYLFFNKSFAYLHVPGTPVFVGEIVLAIGIADLLRVRSPWYLLLRGSPILRVLLVFMALCTARLAADLPVYGLDAVRDSSIWYYGLFAFVVAAAAVREPTFVPRLLRWYRRVLPWYFVWAPIAVVLSQIDALSSVYVPGSDTPINTFRPNDIGVNLGVGIAFLWLGVDRMVDAGSPRSRDALISIAGLLALLVSSSQNRGGFVAAAGTLGIAFACLPAGRRRRLVLSVTAGLLVVLTVVGTLDLRIHREPRDVSLQQLAANLASIAGREESEQLSDTKEWREKFWQQVVDDLLDSSAWLTGLGFGPILPERYEVEVGWTNFETSTRPLRSAHNSHLTILARVGVPGLGLWLLLWLTYGVHLLRWVRRRPGGVRDPANAAAVWYSAAVPGFLISAYFDPSLEGPHAAIWLFTLVGLAAAHTLDGRRRSAPAGPPR